MDIVRNKYTELHMMLRITGYIGYGRVLLWLKSFLFNKAANQLFIFLGLLILGLITYICCGGPLCPLQKKVLARRPIFFSLIFSLILPSVAEFGYLLLNSYRIRLASYHKWYY